MRTLQLLAVAATLLLSRSGIAADQAPCKTDGYDHRLYEVFVDEPTGYAFIKTPCGWHFVRQIEQDKVTLAIQLSQRTPLPPTAGDQVVTLHPSTR